MKLRWLHLKNLKTAISSGKREWTREPKILVAGLGNLILQDDGVGVHAVREFQDLPQNVYTAVDVGCAVFDAMHLFEWAEKILLIDAMQAGGPPGTVYKVDSVNDLEEKTAPLSLHDLSVLQALKMSNRDHHPEIKMIGVEPETIDFGVELTERVREALPLVLHTGQEIVEEWLKEYRTD